MHNLYRAIGFSKIKSRFQLENLYREAMASPDRKTTASVDLGRSIIQLDKEFGDGIGITLIGEIDPTQRISIEHVFPFAAPTRLTKLVDLRIEKHISNESYDGIIDELTISVIFYLQNIADFVHLKWMQKVPYIETCMLAGLSGSGTILLPINRDKEEDLKIKKQHINRMRLVELAKSGDETAIEDLAIMSLDLKNDMYNKALREDILSVVDTTMIPYGIDCEAYDIVGIIEDYAVIKNRLSGEEVVRMTLQCNEYHIDVYINSLDLNGEPGVGRRFRGVVWLQGYINF
jgi:hypothetical protein